MGRSFGADAGTPVCPQLVPIIVTFLADLTARICQFAAADLGCGYLSD